MMIRDAANPAARTHGAAPALSRGAICGTRTIGQTIDHD